ncbi:MAG: fumarylacetoacetase [Pseudonocardia sp.]
MTWLDLPADTGFGIANLPYGVFDAGAGRRLGIAIGEDVLDVAAVAARRAPDLAPLLTAPVLNPLLAAGASTWRRVRAAVVDWLTDPTAAADVRPHLHRRAAVTLHLPYEVADYVDFYASEHHAANVGRIFGRAEPLHPNWRHLPCGYHGRAGSVVVSGTPVRRPHGPLGAGEFGPTRRLDFECEVGFLLGPGSDAPVPTADVAEHVFGVFLLDDWSARDVQAWETVPLGPFLGKSFSTSVSPWVVPLAALDAAWVDPPRQDPQPLPYLRGGRGLDLALTVTLNGEVLSRPPFASMYWTPAQMLAHLTVNGARTRPGDVFASGTVSGPGRGERGCLLELSWGGTEPLALTDGSTRTFLCDGDEVVIAATAPGPRGTGIDLGEVRGTVVG